MSVRPVLVLFLLVTAATAQAGWPTLTGVPLELSGSDSSKSGLVMVSDGMDGAFTAWHEQPDGSGRLAIQHVDADGEILLQAGGKTVLTSSGTIRDLSAMADGTGGFFLSWARGSTAFGFDIYVTHFNSSGQATCVATDIMDLGTSSQSVDIQMASDGAGGAYVAWVWGEDSFLTRLGTNGLPLWGSPTMVYDGSYAMYPVKVVIAPNGSDNVLMAFNIYDDMSFQTYGLIDLLDNQGESLWSALGYETNLFVAAEALPNGDTAVLTGLYSNVVGAGGGLLSAAWVRNFPAHSIGATKICTTPENGFFVSGLGTADVQGETLGMVVVQKFNSSLVRQWGTSGASQTSQHQPGSMELVLHDDGDVTAIMMDTGWTVFASNFTAGGLATWESPAFLCSATSCYDLAAVAGQTGDILASWHSYDIVNIGQIDAMGWPADNRPHLTGVSDLPNDQGGLCLVDWAPALRDNYSERLITQYTLWRRLPAKSSSGLPADLVDITKLPLPAVTLLQEKGWDLISTTEAWAMDAYTDTGASFGDSTATGIPQTEFMVIAHSTAGGPFWTSEVLSGWSVDNLAPGAPLELAANTEGPEVVLNWLPSGLHDEDFSFYNIYTSVTENVTINPENLLGTATDPEFAMSGGVSCFVVVTAVDVHGNESLVSNEIAMTTVSHAGDIPENFMTSLAASPNPFNPRTKISFSLPASSTVELGIYNVSGQLVRTLVSGVFAAGTHEMSWDGTNRQGTPAGSGVYFAILKSAGGQKSIKLMLVK